MALPNVGGWDNSPNQAKKRAFGNESKGMDEILGSNLSKDYQKAGSLVRNDRSLPNLIQNDPRLGNIKVNLSNIPTTPTTKDRKPQRDSSREVMDAYRSAPVHQYSEQGDRIESMERTMKFLIEQINNFEKMMYNETRKSKSKYDAEKEQIEKLELAMKLYEDNYSLGNNELANKVALLEARQLREEKAKIELREKLSFTELNQRELLEYVKALQSQENSELIQMRGMIQERMTDDQGSNIKEKERSKTLFHEVVRLGEQQEKADEMIHNMNLVLEGKLKVLEAKMQVNDRAVNTLNERGSAGLNNLSSWNDKVENRVKDLESNLYAITREQIKDKETIAKLQGINNKLSEDLAHLLTNMNNDYNQKLDVRVTELVNRIVMEHEERIKNQNDIKQHIDVTNQITSEKHSYDREEMRERYNSMDTLVRAEFERKDEAIRTLHNIIETQVRALQANIKQEELGRNQFEGYLRQEMGRYQDEVKREFEDFRKQQALTTEKITEMIKIEIETRLGSDIELKNQMNTIAQDLSQDIELIKSHTDRSVEALSKEVRTVAADSAERANQLSRYIDQEVDSTNQNSNSKFDKLKTLFSKFGEQFKNHLLNTEVFRKESATKAMEMEQSVEFNKDEIRRQIEELEGRLDERFREQREVVDNALDNQNKVLEDRIDKIKDQKEGDIDVVKEAIENNRMMFNNKIEQLMQVQEASNTEMTELVTKMVKDVENVMKEVDEVKEDVSHVKGELGDEILDLKGYVEMEFVTERTIRNQLLEDSYENLKKNINDVNSAINLLRIADDKMGKLVDGMEQRYDDRFHTFANQLSEAFLKLAGLNDNLANFEEKAKEDNLQLVGRMTADNVLLENNTKMLFTELKNVTEIVLQKNTQMKVFQERIITFLINLNKESDEIKQRVEKEILVAMDNKIMMMMEKIKKQDQQQWEKTLYHVNTGFNEAKPFISTQVPAKSKLHELVMQEDVYQDPLLKTSSQSKGQASKDQTTNKGAKPQENVQQPNSSQAGTQRASTPQKGNGKK